MELEFSVPCESKSEDVCHTCGATAPLVKRKTDSTVRFAGGFRTVYTVHCSKCGVELGMYVSSAEPLAAENVYTEIDPSIAELVEQCGGYCPCAIEQTEDTKCPCKEFREGADEICHCGRYRKE